MLIEIEGIDGTGKTEQCKLIKQWLESRGEQAVIVKDLESTPVGKQIRQILKELATNIGIELWGFACAKEHLIKEVIEPTLDAGIHVICDRGTGSLLSYFEAHGLNSDVLERIVDTITTPKYTPTTILIDLEVSKAISRNSQKSDFGSKFDLMGNSFFEKQRAIYLRLASAKKWHVVSGDGTIAEISNTILGILAK